MMRVMKGGAVGEREKVFSCDCLLWVRFVYRGPLLWQRQRCGVRERECTKYGICNLKSDFKSL